MQLGLTAPSGSDEGTNCDCQLPPDPTRLGGGGGRFKGMLGSSLRSKKRARCPGRQNECQAKQQRSNLDSGPGFRMAAPSSTAGSGGTAEGSRCVSSLSRLIGRNLPSTVSTALCGSKLEGLPLQGLSDRRARLATPGLQPDEHLGGRLPKMPRRGGSGSSESKGDLVPFDSLLNRCPLELRKLSGSESSAQPLAASLKRGGGGGPWPSLVITWLQVPGGTMSPLCPYGGMTYLTPTPRNRKGVVNKQKGKWATGLKIQLNAVCISTGWLTLSDTE